jgi:uncharacterized protein YraI
MNKAQEKVLMASLCGLVVVAAGAFAVQPATAAGYHVQSTAQVSGVASWDSLKIRKWPASYSQKINAVPNGTDVWVERCIDNSAKSAADWCLVEVYHMRGWVNAKYLTPTDQWF